MFNYLFIYFVLGYNRNRLPIKNNVLGRQNSEYKLIT